jgi:hypothetical protein
VKAGTERPEILHQSAFAERVDATPAIAANRIYLRTGSKLYAFSGAALPVAGAASSDRQRSL